MTYLRPIVSIEADGTDIPPEDRGSRGPRRKPRRSGLGAQTVIDNLENIKSYRAFERAICVGLGH